MTSQIVPAKPYRTARTVREGSPQLSLVPRAEVQDADPESYPRLGIPLTRRQQMENEGFSPDEIASVDYFMRRRANPDAELDIVGLDWTGANDYSPHDEYRPNGDAA